MIMGITYFEDADQEILPKTFVEYDWKNIKDYFMKFQTDFQNKLEMLDV